MKFPIRINKYLAQQRVCSRREADTLIEAGKVMINGKRAMLGTMVQATDKVEMKGKTKKLVYLAFHKPKGIITHSPQKGEKSIEDMIKLSHDVYPLGRLDKDSRGLIILTNDGRITDRLLNPAYQHEKEYEVKVNRALTAQALERLSVGVTLDDGYVTKPCTLKKRNNFSFTITLTEGKNRQIRRMCEALGYAVTDLKRIRIMNIMLQELPAGKYRMIAGPELKRFLSSLGLS